MVILSLLLFIQTSFSCLFDEKSPPPPDEILYPRDREGRKCISLSKLAGYELNRILRRYEWKGLSLEWSENVSGPNWIRNNTKPQCVAPNRTPALQRSYRCNEIGMLFILTRAVQCSSHRDIHSYTLLYWQHSVWLALRKYNDWRVSSYAFTTTDSRATPGTRLLTLSQGNTLRYARSKAENLLLYTHTLEGTTQIGKG